MPQPHELIYRADCRHFVGERPCVHKRECADCPHFDEFGTRILIIKLGATGDVLRTTPILRPLRRKYGKCHVTWMVDEVAAPLLKHNPLIDKVLTPDLGAAMRLLAQDFDLLICLDKEDVAIGLATQVRAKTKLGYGMTPQGTLTAFNPESEYAIMLGISDELKFRVNQKTYQQIIFEMLGLEYRADEYALFLPPPALEWAGEMRGRLGLESRTVIGLNTGAGPRFAGKAWPISHLIECCRVLGHRPGTAVLLLGGPDEVERNQAIMRQVDGNVADAGCDHSLTRFAALIGLCDAVVVGDTMAMHLAIAQQKPIVVLFGSTCPQEIDLYGRGRKIVADIECAPCYLRTCPIQEKCMKSITPQQVADTVFELLDQSPAPTTSAL